MTWKDRVELKRTPEQIIGKDALIQLVFEGFAVVPVTPTAHMMDIATILPTSNTLTECNYMFLELWKGALENAEEEYKVVENGR